MSRRQIDALINKCPGTCNLDDSEFDGDDEEEPVIIGSDDNKAS
jgi:hypothetical protein